MGNLVDVTTAVYGLPMTDEQPFTHFAWDINVPGLGEVWLRAESPSGHPTQTWLNGELIRREDKGAFAWVTDAGVPTAIYLMDREAEKYDAETACYLLRQEKNLWSSFLSKPDEFSSAFMAQCAAYVRYADLLLHRLSC